MVGLTETARRWIRRVIKLIPIALGAMLVVAALPGTAAADSGPCGAGSNPIVCENSQPGTPMADWYSPGSWGDIEAFPTTTSVAVGGTVNFSVSSPVGYKLEIYRLGWYGGDGARLMPTSPTATYPAITQPACDTSASTGEVDCGDWSVTASWTVPSNAVSGVYLADFDQSDGGGLMPYPFVVTNPSSTSDMVVQTSDQSWQAYNMWGGADLYQGNGPAPDGRDYAVSYNRPMDVEGENGIFGSEYPMIEFLERNGYDVSYLSSVDITQNPSLLLSHKTYISDGHDEYWDQQQWSAVTAAKDAGVNLAFFSGNEVFWRTELEPSIADGATDRTVATYKMTKMELPQPDGVADPSGQWTGTWMDPAGTGTGGGSPGNQLTGTLFTVNGYRSDAITVSYPYSQDRLWRNTSVASLQPGQTYTTQAGTLGYEWDSDPNNSVRPPGEIDMSSTTVQVTNGTLLQDYGNFYGNGTATHSLTEYRDPKSGALVFGAGTVQWAWGLGTVHADLTSTEDPVMEQATVNLFADMGAQPLTLQSDLVAAAKSTVTTGPTVSVGTPSPNISTSVMSPLTISGTAAPASGAVVARVEVSTNGGTSWNPATGLANWSYIWTPTKTGAATIEVRAEDDTDNIGATTNVPVTVTAAVCPCSVFPDSAVPAKPDSGDANAIDVGMKIQPSVSGAITGVQFYKASTNTGTHVGSLWTSSGTLLGSVTFTNETASGWQFATFAQPIPVTAGTTYVVSYFAPNGHYSDDANYFTNQAAGIAPITGLQAGGSSGSNDVYKYAIGTVFPTTSYQNTNYWVDAIFQSNYTSTSPPTVTSSSPVAGATNVPVNSTLSASLSEGINASTLKFTLTDQHGVVTPGSVTYDPVGHSATFQSAGELSLADTYTASVSATDLWGNTMSAPYTWTFTTAATPPAYTCPCSIWNSTAVPATTSNGDAHPVEVGMRFESAVPGYVTGISFYKGIKNTGTHTGNLWSNTGTLLATGSFTNESASGWQQLTFANPVQIQANTPYIASYYAPTGHYASNGAYFTVPITDYPITALGSTTGSGNGLYAYSNSSTFPNSSYNATNYWVDVDFATQAPVSGGTSGEATQASTARTATGAVEAAAATGGSRGTSTVTPTTSSWENAAYPATVGFAQAVEPQSLHLTVTAATGNEGSESPAHTVIAGTVEYNPSTFTASFRPDQPLPPGTTYHAVATAVSVGGSAVSPIAWNFTVVGPQPLRTPSGGVPAENGAPPPVVQANDTDWASRRLAPLPDEM
ncbi:MAG TPA: DUF4082 domain-containing protein [Actinospica sp.]|nr:DUF4082 domain-containing protein [Actinospica sp.]